MNMDEIIATPIAELIASLQRETAQIRDDLRVMVAMIQRLDGTVH